MIQTQQGIDPQKTAQQTETKDFQIFVEWFYTVQAFASQRTTGKQKRFNQLLTQSSGWLFLQFLQFSTLGTIIKSPLSGTKQATGILAGHNGKPSQRMASITKAGVSQLQLSPPNTANFKAPKHSIPYTRTLLERPRNAFWQQKNLRRQTKWGLLIRKFESPAYSTPRCPGCFNSPTSHAQFLPCKLFVKVVWFWWIVLNPKMQRVWRSNCTCRDFKWGKKVYSCCSLANKAEQSPHHPTTQETQN